MNKNFFSEYKVIFFLFYAVGVVFYIPTFKSREVFDYVDFIYKYKEQGVLGLLYCFHEATSTAVYFFHLITFTLYKIFGVGSAWLGLLAVLLHSTCAVFIVYFFSLLNKPEKANYKIGNILIGFCFLLSPYASEVVVWGCTLHYLVLGNCLIISLICIYKYAITNKLVYKYILFFAYFISLFLHELSFVFIPIFLGTYLFINKGDIFSLTITFWKNYYPLLLLFLFCLLIRLLATGEIIGHYGAATHLNFEIKECLIKFHLYIFKFLGLGNSFDIWQPVREYIKEHIFKTMLIEAVLFLPLFYILFRTEYIRKFLCFILILFFSILPVLNLYYVDYLHIAGDRLGYIASIIFYIYIGYFILHLDRTKQKYFYTIYFSLIIIFSGIALSRNNYYWYQSAKLMNQMEKFDFGNGNTYYLLNMPESYCGAYMYKGGDGQNPFERRLNIVKNKFGNNFVEVLSMTFMNKNNKLQVNSFDSNSFVVDIINPEGSWFWKGDYGAKDYENNYFKVKLNKWNTGYVLTFKHIEKNSFLLYYTDGKWIKEKLI